MKNILNKIKSKKAVIGIIGMGYVGIPLLIRFSDSGFRTIGFDVDKKKVDMINNGRSYIQHIKSKKLKTIKNTNSFATNNFKEISLLDAVIICVPTPLKKNRTPDVSYIKNSIKQISPYIKSNQIISLESTSYPGTTEEIILPEINKKGLKVGKNFFLVYSPEREDPGNKKFNTNTIPKVVGGTTHNCCIVGKALYSSAIKYVVPVSSTRTAEMTKLLENIYRAVNIGLVNEMKIIATKMNININEVISAAATKPFGFTPFFPGPGLGGHCIPVDPFYLSWKAKNVGADTKFIELAGTINRNMPNWVCKKIVGVLNKNKIKIEKAKILILGVAYKKNIDDYRESPAIPIIENLLKLKAKVKFSDPYIKEISLTKPTKSKLRSIKINKQIIRNYDASVIITDHDKFNYKDILIASSIVVDTRNKFKKSDEKIYRA